MKLKHILQENRVVSLQPLTEYDDDRMRDFEDDHSEGGADAYDRDGELTSLGEDIAAKAYDSFHTVFAGWIKSLTDDIINKVDDNNDQRKILFNYILDEFPNQIEMSDMISHFGEFHG